MEPLTSDDPREVAGYRLSARLGAGGMGLVYLAFTPSGRPVAFKVVRPELADDQEFRNRFRHEVEAARRVHGAYTAQVLDADPAGERPWLATEYVPGPSLLQAVREHGPLPEQTMFLLLAGVAKALQAIHSAGVVHRDLKPSNVLLAPAGPRVIDFGIARAIEATALTRSGMRVGSPQFMAPEQVAGLPVSPAIDVFALGALAAYAALGRSPFGAGNDAAILYRVLHAVPDLGGCPADLRTLIERCLAKQAAARPALAEIISFCRARTARAGQAAQSWLPPAMAATVRAAPALPPPAPPAPAPPAPGVPAPGVPAPASATVSAPALPSGYPPGQARVGPTRTIVIGGLAAVIVAAVSGAGLVALHNAAGSHGGPGRATAPPLARPAGASPGPSATLDSCLLGTWTGISEDVTNTIDNEPVQFTGPGPVLTFGPDGSATTDYGQGTEFTANVGGDDWTETVQGSATMHYEIQDGMLLTSDVSAQGSYTLAVNGSYDSGGPLSIDPAPASYTCSGDSLQEHSASGDSMELTRNVAG